MLCERSYALVVPMSNAHRSFMFCRQPGRPDFPELQVIQASVPWSSARAEWRKARRGHIPRALFLKLQIIYVFYYVPFLKEKSDFARKKQIANAVCRTVEWVQLRFDSPCSLRIVGRQDGTAGFFFKINCMIKFVDIKELIKSPIVPKVPTHSFVNWLTHQRTVQTFISRKSEVYTEEVPYGVEKE